MKQHVFKRSRTVKGKRMRARTYSGRYRLDGDPKDTEVSLGVTDKQAAQAKLAEIVRDEERVRQGLASPVRQVEAASTSLDSLVREWLRNLASKGRDSRYCDHLRQRMGILMRECQWSKVSDIRPYSFDNWRSRNPQKSAKTLNEYLACARSFLNWMVKSEQLPSNPLLAVGKSDTRGREVRKRRSFSHDEFLRLLDVADESRRIVYAVAYYTGLRRSEIVSLCWEAFDLAAGSVRIRAEHAKNRTDAILPVHPDLLQALVRYFEALGRPVASAKAFSVPPRLRAFDRDLKAAGIAKRDELGRVADFHSLRHSCATRLASENVPLPVAMKIMRHSDPKLTAKAYVDQGALPLVESIAKLPGLSKGKQWSPDSSLASGVSGDSVPQPVATHAPDSPPQVSVDELLRRVLSHLGVSGPMVAGVGFESRYVIELQSVAFITVLGFTRFFHVHGFPGISYGSRFEQQREGNLSPFVTKHQ